MKHKDLKIAKKIGIAMLLGIIFGLIANAYFSKSVNTTLVKYAIAPIGDLFIRGIKLVVVPIVLCSLIVGASNMGNSKRLGRVGLKTFIYFIVTTIIACTLAVVFAHIFKPGANLGLALPKEYKAKEAPFFIDVILNMVPTNPFDALAKGEVLQVITFSLLFGVACTIIGEKVAPILKFISLLNDICIKILGFVMYLAPIATFCLISKVLIEVGISAIKPLISYTLLQVSTLSLHFIVVYSLALIIFAKLNPIKFIKGYWPVVAFAFTTASSNATIPLNLRTCEETLGADKSVTSFMIPLGATVNMDGSAIMQCLAPIFIAQAYGIPIGFQQSLIIILIATLASVAVAGVPSASIVVLPMVLAQIGVPVEGIALILGVDRFLDMCRTVLNVTGDAVGACIVSKSENLLDIDKFNNLKNSNKIATTISS